MVEPYGRYLPLPAHPPQLKVDRIVRHATSDHQADASEPMEGSGPGRLVHSLVESSSSRGEQTAARRRRQSQHRDERAPVGP